MENQNTNNNNNKIVISLLIIIIVLLSILCILLATGTISFNSNSKDNNQTNENTNNIEKNETNNKNNTVKDNEINQNTNNNDKLDEDINNSNSNEIMDNNVNIDLVIDSAIVSKDAPNSKIFIKGSINLSYDNNKYAGVALSGYCLGTDNEKYFINGPGDGGVLLFYNDNKTLSLTENIPQNVEYIDGTSKNWGDVDWENVKIKYCKIDNMKIVLSDWKTYHNVPLNFEKTFN